DRGAHDRVHRARHDGRRPLLRANRPPLRRRDGGPAGALDVDERRDRARHAAGGARRRPPEVPRAGQGPKIVLDGRRGRELDTLSNFMARAARQAPRPYLAAPLRRGHLLDAAGRLVRRGGWPALSMQGVAAAAGVSRQLVYEHFATAADLYLATLVHL